MFRDLVPIIAERCRIIAPDHLRFGLSDAPTAARPCAADGVGSAAVQLGKTLGCEDTTQAAISVTRHPEGNGVDIPK